VIVFLCAKRGRILLQIFFRHQPLGLPIKTVMIAAAVLPVFCGVDLTDLHHPRITCTHPTLFPSGAGVAPTGAYLAFARQLRQTHGLLDHNQAIWNAAKSTDFAADSFGAVHYLFSPVESYMRFAIRLQNKRPDGFPIGREQWPDNFYVESRSLMRYQYVYASDKVPLEKLLTQTTLTPVSKADWQGVAILHAKVIAPAETNSPFFPLWAFNSIFGSDEFRLEPLSCLNNVPRELGGKKLVITSRKDFQVTTSLPLKKSILHHAVLGDWHVAEIGPLQSGCKIELPDADQSVVSVAVSAFPDWLSLKKM
jgi:hypothetical protein